MGKTSFWSEGPEHLEEALREAEAEELSTLSSRLAKAEDAAARAEVLAEIERVKSRYREHRRARGHILFATADPSPDDGPADG